MKKLYPLALALSMAGGLLTAPAQAAEIRVDITETSVGAGPETLSVSGFPGATIGGTTDDWTITFPGLSTGAGNFPMAWVEAAGDPGFNVLSVVGPSEVGLMSEVPTFPAVDCGSTPAPLPLGLACGIGFLAGNFYFAALHEVKIAAPEPASLALLGSGLLGFGVIRRRRKL